MPVVDNDPARKFEVRSWKLGWNCSIAPIPILQYSFMHQVWNLHNWGGLDNLAPRCSGSALFYINSWAIVWPSDHPKVDVRRWLRRQIMLADKYQYITIHNNTHSSIQIQAIRTRTYLVHFSGFSFISSMNTCKIHPNTYTIHINDTHPTNPESEWGQRLLV